MYNQCDRIRFFTTVEGHVWLNKKDLLERIEQVEGTWFWQWWKLRNLRKSIEGCQNKK